MTVFNEPQKWAQTLGKDADVVTIPDIAGDTDPSIDKIFPAVFSIPLAHGGKAIPRSVLNGLFKLLGDWSFYQQNGGIASYSAIFDYAIGRVVLYNGNLYKCIHANGASSTVVTPDSNTAYWQRLDNFVRSVNSVNADDNGNVSITSINHATSADSATNANHATNADHATTADSATNANHATNADHATSADTANRAYPRKVDGADINFNWEGRDGQPTWVWGGEDGTNMYIYSPTNFSVNYALNAGNADHATSADSATNATNLGGYPATKYIRSVTGEIKWFAFNTVPDGYIICNGANVSRTTYADLFNAIGTTFGSGDGSTTFTLPNLIDKFAQGSTTVGTYKSAGLPNIIGGLRGNYFKGSTGYAGDTDYGAFHLGAPGNVFWKGSSPTDYLLQDYSYVFSAHFYNSIYSDNITTVQPPALTLLPCIKY